MKSLKKLLLSLSMCMPLFAYSPVALKSIEKEYFDFLSLEGTVTRPSLEYRTLSDSRWSFNSENHLWMNNKFGCEFSLLDFSSDKSNFFLKGFNNSLIIDIYGPEWFNSYNSYGPYGQNDGALWQGKGYNTSFSTGIRMESLGFELTVKPLISFSQNLYFDLYRDSECTIQNEYGYFWNCSSKIDLPQRFGDKSFINYDWGDTEIRWSWYTFTIGFGTQNPWIGPAWLNPMLGSNNAASYPKFDIGLRKQELVIPWLNWSLGCIEGRMWVGKLTESQYFDYDDSNNNNVIAGFTAAYSPSFIPGLTIGACKVSLGKWGSDYYRFLNPFYKRNGEAEGFSDDQKMSLFIDWCFPKIGFEAYAEFGKDDYSYYLYPNPFHTGIYTVGVKQVFSFEKCKDIKFEIIFEWNNFEMSQDFQAQWKYMGYYSHYTISQGYTNKGQILGAGSGYFGNSQYLGIKCWFPRGNATIYIHRHSPDNNYIYNKDIGSISGTTQDWWSKFKTYFVPGIEGNVFVTKNLLISGNLNIACIYFPEYTNVEKKNSVNFHGEISAKYNF